MRVGILLFPLKDGKELLKLAESLSRALTENGHRVEVVNLKEASETKGHYFEYICLGTEPLGFFASKIDPHLKKTLEQINGLVGKRSFAFLPKRRFSSEKGMTALMNVMESQAMFVRNFAILETPQEAYRVALGLQIERRVP